jgi:Tfp pilus assembly protein PilF
MTSGAVKMLSVILGACLTACSHNTEFKRSTPAVAAATNVQLAIEYMKIGKLANSRDLIERALSQDPGSADVQMTAGLVYERLNDMAKAERAYSIGYRLGKGDPNIQNTYAGFLCRTGKAVDRA